MDGWVWSTPLEEAELLVNIPLGAWLDLSFLGSLQVSLPQPHDGGGKVPIPIQGHFLDVPADGSFWTHRPAQLPPLIKELWVNTTLPNQPMSEWTALKPMDEL